MGLPNGCNDPVALYGALIPVRWARGMASGERAAKPAAFLVDVPGFLIFHWHPGYIVQER